MVERDIVSEAQYWRGQMLHPSMSETRKRVYDCIRPLADAHLVEAFNLWWHTYSTGIRLAPSNKPGQGVSSHDVRRAAKAADEIVFAQFEGLET